MRKLVFLLLLSGFFGSGFAARAPQIVCERLRGAGPPVVRRLAVA